MCSNEGVRIGGLIKGGSVLIQGTGGGVLTLEIGCSAAGGGMKCVQLYLLCLLDSCGHERQSIWVL